jgi:hypothetical protein
LLQRVDLPGGRWLEPSAGSGRIVREVLARRDDVDMHAVEIRPEMRGPLAAAGAQVRIGDWLTMSRERVDVVIGNPPYSRACEFIARACLVAPIVVYLLPLSFFGSASRETLFAAHPPARLFVLPNRPSFRSDGRTDSVEYAWWLWVDGYEGPTTIERLAITSREERQGG